MTAPFETGNPLELIDRAITELRSALAHTNAATALATKAHQTLSTGIENPVKPPLNAPLTRDEVQAEHRRAHRSGRPAKIEVDPELEAFILARIDTLTFAQIICEVRATFTPDRHCSHSGLGRWWQKRRGQ